jgi:uncharacterized protein (TIGR03067 family)
MLKTFLCVAAFAAALGVTRAEDTKPMKFEGSYTIVSGEKDGKALPAEHFTSSLVIITADKIVGTDKDKKQIFGCTYMVDAKAKPMKITMKSTPMGEAPTTADQKIRNLSAS